jgi:hypothetical protein
LVYFRFSFFVIKIMADAPGVVMAEPLESASDRDAANFRDASMRQLEMYVDKAKRLAEESISLGNCTSDKRRKAAIDRRGAARYPRQCRGPAIVHRWHAPSVEGGCITELYTHAYQRECYLEKSSR